MAHEEVLDKQKLLDSAFQVYQVLFFGAEVDEHQGVKWQCFGVRSGKYYFILPEFNWLFILIFNIFFI